MNSVPSFSGPGVLLSEMPSLGDEVLGPIGFAIINLHHLSTSHLCLHRVLIPSLSLGKLTHSSQPHACLIFLKPAFILSLPRPALLCLQPHHFLHKVEIQVPWLSLQI